MESTLERLAEGRAVAVSELRAIADTLEGLPLDEAAEFLILMEPALTGLQRRFAVIARRG